MANAQLGQIESQLWTAQARAARLRAEQADQRSLAYPDDLIAAGKRNPVAADAMTTEQRLFAARWDGFDGSLAINRRKIDQLREQIVALKAQQSATSDRLRYTTEELTTIKVAAGKGYERRPRLLEMQRLSAELKGRVGELAATSLRRNRPSPPPNCDPGPQAHPPDGDRRPAPADPINAGRHDRAVARRYRCGQP